MNKKEQQDRHLIMENLKNIALSDMHLRIYSTSYLSTKSLLLREVRNKACRPLTEK